MTCSNHASCELFPQFAMEPSLKVWQQHFCEGNFKICARYKYSVEGKPVPLTLLPNGKMLNKVRNKEELGGTALFNAIYKGRTAMVKSMLKTKTSSTAIVGPDGMTPLMAAASIGHLDLVGLFLEYGCNPYHRNSDNKLALDIASEANYTECADLIRTHMNSNPELQAQSQTISKQPPEAPDEEAASMSDVIGFLRKLNPFKKS